MPNWPDPSTSSENIWYTEAISYTGVIYTVNFPLLVETFKLTFHAETVTSSLVLAKLLPFQNVFQVLPNMQLSLNAEVELRRKLRDQKMSLQLPHFCSVKASTGCFGDRRTRISFLI